MFQYDAVSWLPSAILGSLSAVCVLLALVLPDTGGRDLPVTVAEVASWPKWLTPEETRQVKENNRLVWKTACSRNRPDTELTEYVANKTAEVQNPVDSVCKDMPVNGGHENLAYVSEETVSVKL